MGIVRDGGWKEGKEAEREGRGVELVVV